MLGTRLRSLINIFLIFHYIAKIHNYFRFTNTYDCSFTFRLSYSITSGNTNTDFHILPSDGRLQVINGLDREVTPSYTLFIEVRDNGSPARSATTSATVTIIDVNDNDPVYVGEPFNFVVAENSPSATLVDSLDATDADTSLNANLLFTIQVFWQGGSSDFSLDAATGNLLTAVSTLDREVTGNSECCLLNIYVLWMV